MVYVAALAGNDAPSAVACLTRPVVHSIRLRDSSVLRACVPEATVAEDRQSQTGKGHVDLTARSPAATRTSFLNLMPRRCSSFRSASSGCVSARRLARILALAAGRWA